MATNTEGFTCKYCEKEFSPGDKHYRNNCGGNCAWYRLFKGEEKMRENNYASVPDPVAFDESDSNDSVVTQPDKEEPDSDDSFSGYYCSCCENKFYSDDTDYMKNEDVCGKCHWYHENMPPPPDDEHSSDDDDDDDKPFSAYYCSCCENKVYSDDYDYMKNEDLCRKCHSYR